MVRNPDGERVLIMMRWGMPAPPKFGGPPVTIRNTACPALARLAEARKADAWCRLTALRSLRQSQP